MTALSRYEKLECTAQYFASRDSAAEDVIAALGTTTLVLSRSDGIPLAHWDLGSLVELDSTESGVWIAPDDTAAEFLFVTEPTMIEAISTLQTASKGPAKSRGFGKVNGVLLMACAGATLAAVGFFTLRDRASDFLPAPVLAKMQDSWIQSNDALLCTTPESQTTVHALEKKLNARIVVLETAKTPVTGLPAGGLAISNDLVKRADSAVAMAGYLTLVQDREAKLKSVNTAINQLPPWDLAQLFITPNAGAAQAEKVTMPALGTASTLHPSALNLLQKRNLTVQPVAELLQSLGQINLAQFLLDASPENEASADLVSDGAWLAFQNVCDR